MSRPRLERLSPDLYGALFHQPACAALVLGDSACKSPFHHAALAYFAARAPVRVLLFCGPGAAHHADIAREHLDEIAPAPKPAVRTLASFDDIDLQLAAEALVESAGDETAIILLDDKAALEGAFWRALQAEVARRGAS